MASPTIDSSPIAGAIEKARSAFLTNTTRASHGWKLRQLFGLSQLLITHKEDLFALFSHSALIRLQLGGELVLS